MKFFRRRDRDLDDEIRTHLRMLAEDRAALGESPEEAQSAARYEFGNLGLIKK